MNRTCARFLGQPHVEYELAAEYDADRYIRPGVVCENMAPKPFCLVLGNELLLVGESDYPKEQRFEVRQYTIETVCDAMRYIAPPLADWMKVVPPGIDSALDVFVGYVMLDAWIAKQDRHHENWGALYDGMAVRLAPTFDHRAALARNLLDSEREERLITTDRNRMVTAFAQRGRSAFYASADDMRPLELREAFWAFATEAPVAAEAWRARLGAVNREAVWSILERVPSDRMSEICKRFTMELLVTNQRRLLE